MAHYVSVINTSNRGIAPIRAKYCESFLDRLKGFTFHSSLENSEGLVLVEKRDSRMDTSIHMLFVWTDLAVIWIDSSYTVVDTVLAKSWAPAYLPKAPARFVLEIHPSRLKEFKSGDKVEFKNA